MHIHIVPTPWSESNPWKLPGGQERRRWLFERLQGLGAKVTRLTERTAGPSSRLTSHILCPTTIYIHIYIYIQTCICTCMYAYIYIYACTQRYIHICMYSGRQGERKRERERDIQICVYMYMAPPCDLRVHLDGSLTWSFGYFRCLFRGFRRLARRQCGAATLLEP